MLIRKTIIIYSENNRRHVNISVDNMLKQVVHIITTELEMVAAETTAISQLPGTTLRNRKSPVSKPLRHC
jgi:hypothetical protein